MSNVKRSLTFAPLSVVLGIFLLSSSLPAQDKPAAAEPTQIEAPAPSAAAPGIEAKKEDPGAAPAQFTQGLLEQIGGAKVAMDTM